MSHSVRPVAWVMAAVVALYAVSGASVRGQGRGVELTGEMVKNSISRGTSFLATLQNGNGSFGTAGLGRGNYPVGPSALCTLALLNSGVSPQDPVIEKALELSADLPRSGRDV